MGDVTVTLAFNGHLIAVPCQQAEVPTGDGSPIPEGYVRIQGATGFDPADGAVGTLPKIREDGTILVSDEYVAMIQQEG